MLSDSLINRVPLAKRKALYYSPDFIPYTLTKKEYVDGLTYLAKPKRLSMKRFLYTRRLLHKRVGPFTFAWQNIRGMFGFTNHCKKHLVGLTLLKLCYYGYVNGFHDDETGALVRHLLKAYDRSVLNNVLKRVPDQQTSIELQDSLIRYHQQNRGSFPQLRIRDQRPLYFGRTMLDYGGHALLAKLDPQGQAIAELLHSDNCPYEPLASTYFHSRLLSYYVDKAKNHFFPDGIFSSTKSTFWTFLGKEKDYLFYMERALLLDPEVRKSHKVLFVLYFLKTLNHQGAVELLNASTDTDEVNELIQMIHFYKEKEKLLPYIDKNSMLGKTYATFLLKESKKGWFSSGKEALVREAMQLNSHEIEEQKPQEALDHYLFNKQWQKAYAFFCASKEKGIVFKASQKEILSNGLMALAETCYQEGGNKRERSEWQEAEQQYERSYLFMQQANDAFPTDINKSQVKVHTRLYAQLMIYVDKSQKRENIERYKTIMALLEDCQKDVIQVDTYLKPVLIDACESYFSLLKVKCYGTSLKDDHLSASEDSKKRSAPYVNEVIYILTIVIEAYDSMPKITTEQERTLAYYYFQLAEFIDYFQLERDSLSAYKKASDLSPANGVYMTVYGLKASDESMQLNGIACLYSSGFPKGNASLIFYEWYEQRWFVPAERRPAAYSPAITDVKSCHYLEKEKSDGFFSFLKI